MKELRALRMLADAMNRASGHADIEGMTMKTPGNPVEVSYYVHALSKNDRIFDVWFLEDRQVFEVHENNGVEFLMPLQCVTDALGV